MAEKYQSRITALKYFQTVPDGLVRGLKSADAAHYLMKLVEIHDSLDGKDKLDNGWFYVFYKRIEVELGFSAKKQRGIIDRLKAIGLIETRLINGAGNNPRRIFQLNIDQIVGFIKAHPRAEFKTLTPLPEGNHPHAPREGGSCPEGTTPLPEGKEGHAQREGGSCPKGRRVMPLGQGNYTIEQTLDQTLNQTEEQTQDAEAVLSLRRPDGRAASNSTGTINPEDSQAVEDASLSGVDESKTNGAPPRPLGVHGQLNEGNAPAPADAPADDEIEAAIRQAFAGPAEPEPEPEQEDTQPPALSSNCTVIGGNQDMDIEAQIMALLDKSKDQPETHSETIN